MCGRGHSLQLVGDLGTASEKQTAGSGAPGTGRCWSPFRQVVGVTPQEGSAGPTVFSKASHWGTMLRRDRIHRPLPGGYLGQDCPPAYALLLLPSGCFCQSLTVTAKRSCSPTPAHPTRLGESATGSLREEGADICLNWSYPCKSPQPLPTPLAFDE